MRACTLIRSGTLAVAFVATTCVPDFTPASQLDESPQVLAVRAEPPEAAPGQTVRLAALLHWPGDVPEHLWLVCVPTAVDTIDACVSNRLGAGGVLLPLCASAPGAPLCYASRDATALYTVPVDLPLDEDGRATIFFELVVGDDVDGDECVRAYRDLDPSERCLVALKRLAVSVVEAPNVSPVLRPLALVVDGQPVDGMDLVPLDPSGAQGDELAVSLSLDVVPQSVDEVMSGDEPLRLPVAWYTTCGRFDEDADSLVCQAPATGQTDPRCEPVVVQWKPAASGECTVHVTVRDGRGGVAWLTQRFVVGSGN
jgi:hypothetical protein